jgi:hypothetical protein
MFELNKGEGSFWKPMFDIWPRDTDILFNWEPEDLEWLQDGTLEGDVNRQYQDFLTSWDKLYRCLSKYPEYFSEESISLYRYRWVYMLTTNRCFGSNWPSICAMIPYAELINHENVDVMYDYLDAKTGQTLTGRRENRKTQDREARLYHLLKQKLFLEDLQEELARMESDLKTKMAGGVPKELTAEEKEE